MDFNTILQACYKKGITPFELYCSMLDFCKGDLEIKEQIGVLYNLYKQRDIFDEISLCEEVDFALFLEQYSQKERDCAKKIARFIHPRWVVKDERKSSNRQKIKIQRVVSNTTKAQQKVFLKQNNNVQRQVVTPPTAKVQNNNGVQILAKYIAPKPKKTAKRDIEIRSLLSDVIVLIDSNVTDIITAPDIETAVKYAEQNARIKAKEDPKWHDAEIVSIKKKNSEQLLIFR